MRYALESYRYDSSPRKTNHSIVNTVLLTDAYKNRTVFTIISSILFSHDIYRCEPRGTRLQRKEGQTILGLPGGRCQSGHLPQ